MYKIMIKHTTSSNSSLAEKMYEIYGSEVTSKNATGSTTTFTPFETDDKEVLKAELLKLDKIYGHENIVAYEEIELTYGVEIANEVVDDNTSTDTPDDETDDGDTTNP